MKRAITKARSKDGMKQFLKEEFIMLTQNPAQVQDEQGRIERWEREMVNLDYDREKNCCGNEKPPPENIKNKQDDRKALEEAIEMRQSLYNNLLLRRKALANWNRLKIMLVLLRMNGNKLKRDDD